MANRLLDLFAIRHFPPAPSANGKHAASPVPEQKALVVAPGSFWPINSTGGTADVQPERLAWYRASWLAYACMRYRATKLVEAPVWIAEETDDGEEWLEDDHSLADLLERPNPDMEMADLLQLTSLFLDSTGACLWVKNRDRGKRVGSLYPFSGDSFSVAAAEGRMYGRFQVRTATGQKSYAPEDVILFADPDPADPYRFVSPLDAALGRLGIDRTLVDSVKAGLQNAVVPGMVLSFPDGMNLTDEQKAEFKASLAAGYETARNHGKSLVIGGGVTASRQKLGFDGLRGGELGKEIEAAVCACFQIPPVIIGAYVGLDNSSDRHNLETSVGLFYDNAMLPLWARLEKALTRGLLREADNNPLRFVRFDKTRIKALQEDQAAKADVIQKAGRALTVNDARVMLGLVPLEDERGERLMSESAVSPSTETEEPSLRIVKSVSPRSEAKADDTRWVLFDAVTRAQEYGWELAAAQQLEEDRSAVLRIAERTLRTRQKDDDPYSPADPDSVRELIREIASHLDLNSAVQWRARMKPLTDATGRAAVERLSTELGISFDLLQPGLLEYVEEHSAKLVTQVTDTTKQAIRDVLRDGLAEGEGIPALRKRIEELGVFNRSRAELIARTETTTNSNGAAVESLRAYQAEHGGTFRKRWLSARDSRVREEHLALDGETVGLDEPFSNGLMHPGEPNCRCTTTLHMEDAAA